MAKRSGPHDRALLALRAFGLAYPGAHTKSPWPGHLDLAVNDKTFAYLSLEGDPFSIGVKLPESSQLALELPFVTPTAYGLGKSGWVTAKIVPGDEVPETMFRAWIDESYRAQAPKKLVKELDARAANAPTSVWVKAPGSDAPTRKGKPAKARKPAKKSAPQPTTRPAKTTAARARAKKPSSKP